MTTTTDALEQVCWHPVGAEACLLPLGHEGEHLKGMFEAQRLFNAILRDLRNPSTKASS